ncbi:hypothetical protein [Streptomyces anulatus]|uniref:hypothetical protein n=1 Tax=Streptomyces anulatus TaxID=1892 RepID=UPI002ED43C11|nr:hypothetical protein OG703_00150 [Streptomyces anulatus]
MRALDLLAELEHTGRVATVGEQETLSDWSGWGALPRIFEPAPAEFDYASGADWAEREAVIGNVPYGRYQRYDRVYNGDLKLSIHDHFVLKSLAMTRPGGITELITSRFTLDGKDPAARERMYDLGDLVGAVRLPAGAHHETAGTDVVTDVLFLRRWAEGEPRGDSRWLTATERILPGHEEPVSVNDYFGAHPQYVLGELRATVVGERDAAGGLVEATAAIAVTARTAGLTATPATVPGEGSRRGPGRRWRRSTSPRGHSAWTSTASPRSSRTAPRYRWTFTPTSKSAWSS